MEEDANSFKKPHFYQQNQNAKFQPNPRNKSKSCSSFLLKFLFITLFLSLLPLFPSDPPEFLSNTVFAKSWELIHLLIIGIALSYGLFCRVKTHQIPPKTQISQPFAPNILQHSSIFDYEERNPPDKNGVSSQSCNLFYHTTEPVVVSRRENGKNFDEMSLGLPVRSLRSRVVDSDYEEEEEEGCSSDSDSDMSFKKCEKDDILEGNVGYSSPNLCDFEAKKGKFQSFRSPFSGLCSWLPESPNMGRESSWNENQFYMPFSNFTQVNDFNMVGISPNVENPSNFFMPSAVVPPSVPFSAGDFASGSETWKNSNFGNGNLGVENSGFFMPSTAVNSAMPFSVSDFGSRSRIYNHETESWSKSPNLQYGNTNLFMPSAANSPSMPACVGDFASAIQESESANCNHTWSYVKKKDEMRSEENNNVALGGENTNHFMPSAAFSPSMPTSADGFASSAQNLKSAKINHGRSSPKKKEEMRSKNNNVALSGENTNSFMPAAAFSPSIPTSADGFASSAQNSKSAKINHGRSSLKKKEDMRSTNNNVALSGENTNSFMPSAAFSPSIPTSADGFDSSAQNLKSAKINHGRSSPKKKEEMRSTNNKVALSGENTSNFMPSVPASADDFASPIQKSKSAKFTHGLSFKKKDEMKSEENKCVVLDEDYANNIMPSAASSPSMPPSANYLASSVPESKTAKFSHGSSLKKKDEMRSESSNVALGGENANIVMPSAAFSPSLPTSAEEFASSVKVSKSAKFGKKKEEMRSESKNVAVGSFQEEINSYTLNFDGPLSGCKSKLENGNSGGEILDFFKNTVEVLSSVTAPVNEFASLGTSSRDGKCCDGVSVKKDEERLEKMNEQTSIPERWDSDCFVIPSSENNDMRDLLQENLSPSLIDPSEASSSAGSSTRMSCHEEGSPRNRVEEIDISEIKDVLGENDSYKPSTPSPPPQVQTRRNDDVASSVESSSRALEIRSLLNDDDAHGSPPTPDRRKALSRGSHSRRFSCGFFDRDLRKSFKEEAKEANKKTKGDHHQFSRGGKCGAWDCLKLDVKPTLNKAALKGKSVRTIKPKDTHQEQKCEENNEMVLIKIGISEKRANSDGRKGEKLQEISGTSIIVGLNSKQNSNGATAVLVDDVKEEENDSEIDRKADEFIAKFKQQIRLQKVAPRGDWSRQHRNSSN